MRCCGPIDWSAAVIGLGWSGGPDRVECGAKGIVAEKPMAHTLEEVDRMVGACAAAGVPLCCGAITTTHPSFARAKALLAEGAIGE